MVSSMVDHRGRSWSLLPPDRCSQKQGLPLPLFLDGPRGGTSLPPRIVVHHRRYRSLPPPDRSSGVISPPPYRYSRGLSLPPHSRRGGASLPLSPDHPRGGTSLSPRIEVHHRRYRLLPPPDRSSGVISRPPYRYSRGLSLPPHSSRGGASLPLSPDHPRGGTSLSPRTEVHHRRYRSLPPPDRSSGVISPPPYRYSRGLSLPPHSSRGRASLPLSPNHPRGGTSLSPRTEVHHRRYRSLPPLDRSSGVISPPPYRYSKGLSLPPHSSRGGAFLPLSPDHPRGGTSLSPRTEVHHRRYRSLPPPDRSSGVISPPPYRYSRGLSLSPRTEVHHRRYRSLPPPDRSSGVISPPPYRYSRGLSLPPHSRRGGASLPLSPDHPRGGTSLSPRIEVHHRRYRSLPPLDRSSGIISPPPYHYSRGLSLPPHSSRGRASLPLSPDHPRGGTSLSPRIEVHHRRYRSLPPPDRSSGVISPPPYHYSRGLSLPPHSSRGGASLPLSPDHPRGGTSLSPRTEVHHRRYRSLPPPDRSSGAISPPPYRYSRGLSLPPHSSRGRASLPLSPNHPRGGTSLSPRTEVHHRRYRSLPPPDRSSGVISPPPYRYSKGLSLPPHSSRGGASIPLSPDHPRGGTSLSPRTEVHHRRYRSLPPPYRSSGVISPPPYRYSRGLSLPPHSSRGGASLPLSPDHPRGDTSLSPRIEVHHRRYRSLPPPDRSSGVISPPPYRYTNGLSLPPHSSRGGASLPVSSDHPRGGTSLSPRIVVHHRRYRSLPPPDRSSGVISPPRYRYSRGLSLPPHSSRGGDHPRGGTSNPLDHSRDTTPTSDHGSRTSTQSSTERCHFSDALGRLVAPAARETFLCMWICILGGVAISYLEAVPGGIPVQDKFLQTLSQELFYRKAHKEVSNYCAFFSIEMQVIISTIFISKGIAIFVADKVSAWWGKKRTLIASLLSMIIGVGLTTWFPNTSTLIIGFFIQSFGVGILSQVIPLIKSDIASDSCIYAYDIALLIGPPVAHSINFITSNFPAWGWRLSFGSIFIILVALLLASILLNVLEVDIDTPAYKTLLHPKCRPPLCITLFSGIISLFSAVGAIRFYGPLLFKSTGVSHQIPFIPPIVISGIQLISSLLSLIFVTFFGRRRLLIFGAITKLISEIVLSIDFYTKSHRYKFYKSTPLFFVMGGFAVIAESFLTTPASWLEVSFPTDAKVAGSIIAGTLGAISNSLTGWIPVVAFCKLNRFVYFPYLAIDMLITAFVIILVPETTNTKRVDMVSRVWRRHRIWRRYVSLDDMY